MARIVKKLRDEESWEEYYWNYQFRLARDYLIPALQTWGVELRGRKVLEVGSGNGGCGAAFDAEGCRVTALELDERLVEISIGLNSKAGLDVKVLRGDICDEHCGAFGEGPFDLVLMRDVLEHIEYPQEGLNNIRANLSDTGACFIVFPPYYSPYGAHQQILPKRKLAGIPYNRLPYVQLLPDGVFSWITRGEDSQSREVERLRKIRLTIKRFEKQAATAGFEIIKRKFFISRPTFAIRYGLPVVEASFLSKVPLARELLVTAAYYLLGKGAGPHRRHPR